MNYLDNIGDPEAELGRLETIVSQLERRIAELSSEDLPQRLKSETRRADKLEGFVHELEGRIDLLTARQSTLKESYDALASEARVEQLRADKAEAELAQVEEENHKLKAENKWLNAYTGPALHLLETLADWTPFELRNQFLTGFALPCSPEMAGKWRALQDAVIAVAHQYELEEVA